MKKSHVILVSFAVTLIILLLTGSLAYIKGKNAGLAVLVATQTNQPPAVVSTTNAPPVVLATNAPAPASQVDLLAAEVKALRAANEERKARVKKLLALNEEVRREREMVTNTITVPVTINVTNAPPTVIINGTLNVGGSPMQQSAPTNKAAKPAKKTMSPKATTQGTRGVRVPMYTITNSTSSVRVSGTNTVSETNTSVQNFLHPGRRSLLGVILGGRSNPIPTDTPSGESVQQGRPPTPVVVVEQPYGYPYGYPSAYGWYGHGYPYARVPVYNQSHERQLFGVRFHTR